MKGEQSNEYFSTVSSCNFPISRTPQNNISTLYYQNLLNLNKTEFSLFEFNLH